MVKMVTHRMMDNLTCMLLAKDELQTHLQSQAAALHSINVQHEKMEDSELANDYEQLRRQLVEAAAENDAISRSLQERVASLADVTDAKFKAESEAKVLQVQVKSIQKDMDAHKYELHLLRKQLQIRNDEREQNKKASDASHKQHLDNVKKIARLDSECQRLRSLIRQRLPGPAVIAQMRAECEMTTKMGKKSRSQCTSTPSKSLPNSSYLYHQRERDALAERLHSVEDESKYLKEALAKRSAELQEARQLCARTAMKLSSAQDLVEAMSIGSMPSTPQPPRSMGLVDINEALMQDQDDSTYANHGGVCMPSILHTTTSIDTEEESGCDNREVDELSRAESWASALFAELSHLSNFQGNAADEKLSSSISNSQDIKANAPTNVLQELDLSTALHKVSQKLSHVGESILLSSLATSDCQVNQADTARNYAHIRSSATFGMHPMADNDLLDQGDPNFNILDEISHIKCMLLELRRVMAVQGKLNDSGSTNAIIDDYEGNYDEIRANQEGSIIAGPQFSDATKFSNAAKISSTAAANMEGACEGTKFNGESGTCTANMVDIDDEEILQSPAKFSGIATSGNDNMEDIDMTNLIASPNFSETAKFSGTTTTEHLGTGTIKSSTKFSDSAKFSNVSMDDVPSSLNSAAELSSSLQLEPDDVAPRHLPETNIETAYVDVHLELQALLQAAQAELELARGKNATLEGELSRVLEEKAEVARELSDTCSQKRTLEAELVCSLANVEEMKAQVASLKSLLADRTSTPPLNAKLATQSVTFFDMKEEQDLAIARTQLANCQRNIHVMRKQMTSNISNSLSQDVIIDELPFFDYSSQSSKSLDLNSHLASPNINKAAKFNVVSPKSSDVNIKKPSDISLAQEEHTSSCQTISYDDNAIQANNISHHSKEEVESFEKCRVHVDEHSKTCDQLMRSISSHEVKPSLKPPTKPPKVSTTTRITEFFNKAKSAKASVL